jgi:hypothetical protein
MNNQDTTNESIIIEDLAAKNAEEVKGGPTLKVKRDLVMKSSVAESGNGDNSLQGISLNHNETAVSDEDEDDDKAAATNLADLSVSDQQSSEIAGGLLVPAVQKVREAAAR